MRARANTYYWNCKWWSDFTNEDERLFIGGLIQFKFKTIRDIPRKKDFSNYIRPITMINQMMIGYHIHDIEPTKSDLKYLKEMVDAEMENKFVLSLPSKVDPYILRLFHHFAINIDHIIINLDWMDVQVWRARNRTFYGYKQFRSLLFKDLTDDNSLNIDFFLKFLPNLKSFTIHNFVCKYDPSILVNQPFISSLLKSIAFIQSDKSLNKSFERFVIVHPKLEAMPYDIQDVIAKYNHLFIDCGWELMQIVYEEKMKPNGKCDQSLCIRKV